MTVSPGSAETEWPCGHQRVVCSAHSVNARAGSPGPAGPVRWVVTVGSGCIGSGICLATAPSYFVETSDGKSRPANGEVDANETVRDAAAFCPVEAITVIDAQTGEPLQS